MRVAFIAVALFALAACETTNSDDWTGGQTGFRNAEKSCLDQTQSVEAEDHRREFFIACMGALGWTPRPGASIEL